MSALPSYVQVLREGFGEVREPGVSRTAMESGPPKQLQVKSRVLVTREVMGRVASKTDYTSFITWFQTTIHYGADWFTWTDPVDATSKSARIVRLGTATPDAVLAGAWRFPLTLETWSA